mmetsp:Transcript_8136/g.23253  ORF Transcript_8136/g.23253 Transcript_8136/m.23253 type:complete len:428 (+) Transcript_8136:529-1812(+)
MAPVAQGRKAVPPVLHGEAAILRHDPRPEAHVVRIDHRATVSPPIHGAEVDRVVGSPEGVSHPVRVVQIRSGRGRGLRDAGGLQTSEPLRSELTDVVPVIAGVLLVPELLRVSDVLDGLRERASHALDIEVEAIRAHRLVVQLPVVALRPVEGGFLLHQVQRHQRDYALSRWGHLVHLDAPEGAHDRVPELARVGLQVRQAHHAAPRAHGLHDPLADPTGVKPLLALLREGVEHFRQPRVLEHLPRLGGPIRPTLVPDQQVLPARLGLEELVRARLPAVRRDRGNGKPAPGEIRCRLQQVRHLHGSEGFSHIAPARCRARHRHVQGVLRRYPRLESPVPDETLLETRWTPSVPQNTLHLLGLLVVEQAESISSYPSGARLGHVQGSRHRHTRVRRVPSLSKYGKSCLRSEWLGGGAHPSGSVHRGPP